MKLFHMKDWVLIVSEEAWGLAPFKRILKRDRTKNKSKANAEMLFIYYYCDIKSDYLSMDAETRVAELIKDIEGLPKGWEVDDVIKEAIEFYLKFDTVVERLYRQSLKSATAIGNYLERTAELLDERDMQGKPVYDIAKITGSVQKVPKLMSDLKLSYKEVIKEQEDNSKKKKGSKSFNLFEEGL